MDSKFSSEQPLSSPAFQYLFQAQYSFKKNPKPKYRDLTQLVITYQDTRSPKIFNNLIQLTPGLCNKVLGQYGMFDSHPEALENLRSECETILLLEAIETFDRTRGAAFSTHYTWQLKSYVMNKSRQYFRRKNLYHAISFQQPVSEDNANLIEESVSNCTCTSFSRKKRLMERGLKNWINWSEKRVNNWIDSLEIEEALID